MSENGNALDLIYPRQKNNGYVIQCSHFYYSNGESKIGYNVLNSLPTMLKTRDLGISQALDRACLQAFFVSHFLCLFIQIFYFLLLCNSTAGTTKGSVLQNTSWVSLLLNGHIILGDKASSMEMCPLSLQKLSKLENNFLKQ